MRARQAHHINAGHLVDQHQDIDAIVGIEAYHVMTIRRIRPLGCSQFRDVVQQCAMHTTKKKSRHQVHADMSYRKSLSRSQNAIATGSMQVMQSRGEVEYIQESGSAFSYEVPGGFDGSPWLCPPCCCWAIAAYHIAT